MKTARQRLFRGILIAFSLLVLLLAILLSVEVAARWQRRTLVAEMSKNNIFAATKSLYDPQHKRAPMTEVRSDSLWLVPDERYKPNCRLEMDIDGERLAIQTNEFGFRSPSIDVPKPNGIFRIACLGSSTTVEGWTNATTYPALMERQLREQLNSASIEVVNCGISGMRSKTELRRLKDILALEPDLLVEYNAVNDIIDMMQMMRPLVQDSALSSRLPPPMSAKELAEFDRELDDKLFRNLRQIYEECRTRDVTCVFSTFCRPAIEDIDQVERLFFERNLRFWYWKCPDYRIEDYCRLVDRFNEMLEHFCANENILMIDVARQLRGGRDLFVDICHMTPTGIEKKATIIATELKGHLRL